MKSPFPRSFLWLSCLLAVSACGEGSVREKLGMERSAPDEFRVVSRPPLSVPPQFSLVPPMLGDDSQNRIPAHKAAEVLLHGGNVNADTSVVPVNSSPLGSTSAETQFLKNAGADSVDRSARATLIEEHVAREQEAEEGSWWSSMFGGEPASKEPMVDAKKEAQRIKENRAEGKPVDAGETPEVEGRDTGWLGRMLGY